MSQDLQMIHKVTMKLQESLAEINKMLETHLNKSPTKKKSNNNNDNKDSSKPNREQTKSTLPKIKKPPGAFILFSNDQRDLVKGIYPNLSPTETGQVLGKLWNQLPEEDKQNYKNKHEKQMQAFYEKYPQERNKKKQKKGNKSK